MLELALETVCACIPVIWGDGDLHRHINSCDRWAFAPGSRIRSLGAYLTRVP